MSDKPMIVALATYSSVDDAEADRHAVMQAHKEGDLGHVAAAVLHKDANDKLHMDRHDTTAKHLAWGGAAVGALLGIIAPPVGLALLGSTVAAGVVIDAGTLAAVGGLTGHFWHNIPKKDLEEFATLLNAGDAALVVVAVDKQTEQIDATLTKAAKKAIKKYNKGDLEGAYDEALKGLEKADAIAS